MQNIKPVVTILVNIPPQSQQGKLVFYAKKYTKMFMGRRRGPDAVLDSLTRGLREKNISFNINPPENELADVVHALSGVDSLKLALRLKSKGLVKKVIAGPNISVLPTKHESILLDPQIDTIIVPSAWVKEAYIKDAAGTVKGNIDVGQKIQVWPSGVKIPSKETSAQESEKNNILIFKKDAPEDIFDYVIKTLKEKQCTYTVLRYGFFLQETYFKLLYRSRAMIYLQRVESQGIALQEAWALNVPTLIWNKGSFTYPGSTITVYGKVSSPYLTEACGDTFSGIADFNEQFDSFIKNLPSYSPNAHCSENLSDAASIDRYLKIINDTPHE